MNAQTKNIESCWSINNGIFQELYNQKSHIKNSQMNLRSTLPEGAEISVFNLLKRLYYDDGVEGQQQRQLSYNINEIHIDVVQFYDTTEACWQLYMLVSEANSNVNYYYRKNSISDSYLLDIPVFDITLIRCKRYAEPGYDAPAKRHNYMLD